MAHKTLLLQHQRRTDASSVTVINGSPQQSVSHITPSHAAMHIHAALKSRLLHFDLHLHIAAELDITLSRHLFVRRVAQQVESARGRIGERDYPKKEG